MFQRLLATEGLTFSKVSMNAGSADGQSGRSSGSCRKEILLLPAQEVVTGGLVWHMGRRGSEALVPGRLQHALALPSPGRVCCARWRTGCVVPRLRRIASSSLFGSPARGKPRLALRHRSVLLEPLALAATSGVVVNAAVPPLPSRLSPAHQPMCCLRAVFVTQPYFAGAEEPGGSRLPLLSLRAGVAEHVPETSGILCSLRCRPGPGGACTGLPDEEQGCDPVRKRGEEGQCGGCELERRGCGEGTGATMHTLLTARGGCKPPRWLCLPRQQRFGVGWVRQHVLPMKGPVPKVGTAAVSARGWQQRTLRGGSGVSVLTQANNLPLNILG